MPHEPLLLQSLGNQFVFRCADGVMIDGNHRGLSRLIYKWVVQQSADAPCTSIINCLFQRHCIYQVWCCVLCVVRYIAHTHWNKVGSIAVCWSVRVTYKDHKYAVCS